MKAPTALAWTGRAGGSKHLVRKSWRGNRASKTARQDTPREIRSVLHVPRASRGAGSVSRSFGELAANLAALVGFGVDVDVPLAGQQVGRLGVGQIGRALERAAARGDRHGD